MKLTVSGTTYEHVGLSTVDVPKPKRKKAGYGHTYTWEDIDIDTARFIEDCMADAACNLVEAGEGVIAEAIYRDMDRFEHDVREVA